MDEISLAFFFDLNVKPGSVSLTLPEVKISSRESGSDGRIDILFTSLNRGFFIGIMHLSLGLSGGDDGVFCTGWVSCVGVFFPFNQFRSPIVFLHPVSFLPTIMLNGSRHHIILFI